MSVPVEAQSLSKLNYLFANPPQYPRNPTHEAHRPLVLYIVRVPGSQDVFLTPLKPPTKASISLEAIQNSLYYLHVHSSEDEELRESIEQERRSSVEIESSRSKIQRKPLPSTPYVNYPASQRPSPPPKSYPSYQPGPDGQTGASQYERYASRGSNIRFGDNHTSQGTSISRKPVGPRKFTSSTERHSMNAPMHGAESAHNGHLQPETSPTRSESSEQPASNGSSSSDLVHATHYPSKLDHGEDPPELPPRPSNLHGETTPFQAITLIRRDPASGSQWNIGSIRAGGRLENSNLRAVSIQLDTPGYTKFDGHPNIIHPADPLDGESVKRAMTASDDGTTELRSPADHTFVRTLDFRPQHMHGKRFRLQGRTNSMDAVPNFPIQNKPPRSVFSFFSPWQGLCTFNNGIDGRSLRCRHSLTSPGIEEDDTSVNIAELRFNLAWSALSPNDPNKRAAVGPEADTLPISQLLKEPRGGKEALRKGVGHIKTFSKDLRDRIRRDDENANPLEDREGRPVLPPRPHINISQDAELHLERLSLRLGREKAGGGYKGNSAKLGKLIIDDEGLKMGDLVVAACMGVWWQHYVSQGQ